MPYVLVSFADLRIAFDWVSSFAPMESSAYLSRLTGKTHLYSSLIYLEEELPKYIDDDSVYVLVPHKDDLNLGNTLSSPSLVSTCLGVTKNCAPSSIDVALTQDSKTCSKDKTNLNVGTSTKKRPWQTRFASGVPTMG